MKKKLHTQTLLEIVCYLAFAALLLYLCLSGRYKMYVTARMLPYFYFMIAVLALWSLSSLGRLFRPGYKSRSAHILVLLLPILHFFLPHDLILQSNFALQENTGAVASSGEELPADPTAADFAPLDLPPSNSYLPLSGLDEEEKFIFVTDEEFGAWYTELTAHGEAYDGYRIRIKGFIFKSPDFMKENEFMISRLLMTCCVADVAPGGIISVYEDSPSLAADDWYTLEGRLQIEKRTGYCIPRILVEELEAAEPVEGYAYP
ncbi:MAG: TIGR03943 family protein [Peptostreptococcaceae bacterium]|nr:TIGR03943 family protein [Peptostreptococcaceae bacterium]